LNAQIIFKNVLMLFYQKIIKISLWLSKLQLAKVGTFFETSCRNVGVAHVATIHNQRETVF